MNTESQQKSENPILVIGYGNELRGDDAVGPKLARAIESDHIPGVRVIVSQQLTPELADDIAQAGRAIFVDAAVNVTEVMVRPVTADAGLNIIAHANSPEGMLALAQSVFGRTPEAWAVTIPVAQLAFTDRISEKARLGMDAAHEQIRLLTGKDAALRA